MAVDPPRSAPSRRVLVIASECRARPRLDFVAELGGQLSAVLVDTKRGQCVAALPEGTLLIDPLSAQVRAAITDAYARASAEGASLILAYIGHGVAIGEDFYLLPTDANPQRPRADTAVHLTQLLKELREYHPGLYGLLVLVDACESGVGTMKAAREWITAAAQHGGFEFFAATNDQNAYRGIFTRSLVKLLESGLRDEPTPYLRASQLLEPIRQAIAAEQVPTYVAFNPAEGLYLARNTAVAQDSQKPWMHTAVAESIQRLTQDFTLTESCRALAAKCCDTRCLIVRGPPGSGKSTALAAIAAGLAATPGTSIDAIVFLNEGSLPAEIAQTLKTQLMRRLGAHFDSARSRFEESASAFTRQQMAALEREVLGPLRYTTEPVRIALDAIDQLSTFARAPLEDALKVLASDPELSHVRVIVGTREELAIPSSQEYALGRTPNEELLEYLTRRGVSESLRPQLLEKTDGNWLAAKLFSDSVADEDALPSSFVPGSLGEFYDYWLQRCGVYSSAGTQTLFAMLIAAGVGAGETSDRVIDALQSQYNAGTHVELRNFIVQLRGLAVRTEADTVAERVGIFHQTLEEHLRQRHRGTWGFHVWGTLTALCRSYIVIAKEAHHAEHTATALAARLRIVNLLMRRKQWADGTRPSQVSEELWRTMSSDHEGMMRGAALDLVESALDLYGMEKLQVLRAALPWVLEVLPRDDPGAFSVRWHLADASADLSRYDEAIAEMTDLCQAADTYIPGQRDPVMALRCRIAIGNWTVQKGDGIAGVKVLTDAITRFEHNADIQPAEIAHAKVFLAEALIQTRKLEQAQAMLTEAIAAGTETLGAQAPQIMRMRYKLALAAFEQHPSVKTQQELVILADELTTIVGPDDSWTMRCRYDSARASFAVGHYEQGVSILRDLLAHQERLLGVRHHTTLWTRFNLLKVRHDRDATGDAQAWHSFLEDAQGILPESSMMVSSVRQWLSGSGLTPTTASSASPTH